MVHDGRADVIVVSLTSQHTAPLRVVQDALAHATCPVVVVNCGAVLSVEDRLALVAGGAVDVVTLEAVRNGALAPADADALVSRVFRVAGRRPPNDDLVCMPEDGSGPSVVVVGVSTGGPPVLREIFHTFPADFPVPIVVVQHMADGFTAEFAEWLGSECALRVRLARTGDTLTPGELLIAPDRQHTCLRTRGRVMLESGEMIGGHRPAADALFETAARTYGAHVLGVVLTGMGRDGTSGARAIHDAGGRVLVQDPATCAAPSMPQSVRETGAAALCASPAALAREIVRIGRCSLGRAA